MKVTDAASSGTLSASGRTSVEGASRVWLEISSEEEFTLYQLARRRKLDTHDMMEWMSAWRGSLVKESVGGS